MTYRVYWSMPDFDNPKETYADFKDFEDLTEALDCVANCRKMNYEFVTMVSGNVPGNVTKMGVSAPDADYNWTKRRSLALRKDKNLTDEVEVPTDED